MSAQRLGVSSFSTIGHLIHINLKEHLMNQKHEIGKALLNNNKRALAVVNKVSNIENEFRYFPLEILAKRENCDKTDEELMIVEVNENKCRFQFDFSKVYWNSRLSTEHERIINLVHKPCDIVFDLCAGVGPFAVPIAKSKCKVYANDLNPESVKWLKENSKRNKINPEFLEIYNKDAIDFIKTNLKEKLVHEYNIIDRDELTTMPKIHILMNLPAIAITFLSHFRGLLRDGSQIDTELLNLFRKQSLEHTIYCYCFLKGIFKDPNAEVIKMAEQNMGIQLKDNQVEVFRVRNVAPNKEMYRIMIKLDERTLFHTKPVEEVNNSKNASPKKSVRFKRTIHQMGDGDNVEYVDEKRARLCAII